MALSIVADCGRDDPYAQSIQNMATLEFPGSAPQGAASTFEAVVKEVIGTKQHRYGPTPDPESLVAIREVVREAMLKSRMIPILIPWGASKQGPYGVDVAELMALKQLTCLDKRVRAHYAPGIEFSIRLEDLTDSHMFEDHPGWAAKTADYVSTFAKLHQIMAPEYSNIRLESQLMDPLSFALAARRNALFIEEALTWPEDGRGDFLRRNVYGWSGNLPDVQLDFYRRAYDKFYPGEGPAQKDHRLATYFGGAIARFQLKGTGAVFSDTDNPASYITLSFTGIPWGKAGRRIYYRTIPERYTNQHRAPWIGKGYVRIRGNEATPAIAGFNGDDMQFVQSKLVVSNSTASVSISSDYVVME